MGARGERKEGVREGGIDRAVEREGKNECGFTIASA